MTDETDANRLDALFARLVERFADDPAVTPPTVGKGGKFGESALKVDGKIFAMVSGGNLVVKLPRVRVDELVAAGRGAPFDAGRGHVMKVIDLGRVRRHELLGGLIHEYRLAA